MTLIITFTFCYDNLWKSKFMVKPGKLREIFLLLCGHPVGRRELFIVSSVKNYVYILSPVDSY